MTEMSTERTGSKTTSFSRRKLAQGAAWAVPAAAVSAAAPACASSKFSYTMRGSVYMSYSRQADQRCTSGQLLTSLDFKNTVAVGNSPAGFSVFETPRVAGTTSPRTDATLTKYNLTIYIPTGWVNTSASNNGWIPNNTTGATNWTGPSVGTAGYLGGTQYTPFTFTFRMATKSTSTVASGTNITPWPGSNTLDGHFAIQNVCVPEGASYYWAYDRGFTTANGDSYSANNYQDPIKTPMIY